MACSFEMAMAGVAYPEKAESRWLASLADIPKPFEGCPLV
jgi:hypothetical protein